MTDPPAAASPSPDEIRAAVDAALESRHLRGSRNLSAFLRFVVDKTLAGQEGELKEYTIGVAVFAKGDDFDPRADGVVRVNAALLRKKLAAYEAEDGAQATVRIEIPKGSYVPRFRRVDPPAEEARAPTGGAPTPDPPSAPLAAPRRSWPAGWMAAAVAAAAIAGAVLTTWVVRGGEDAAPAPGPLWRGFVDGPGPAVLAFGIPQFFAAKGLYVRDVFVNDADASASAHLRGLEEALQTKLKPTATYTGIGETHGAVLLAQHFARHGRTLRVLPTRLVGWDDVKDASVVFLSSMRFRTIAQDLELPGDFVFGSEGDSAVVENRRPQAGEAARYVPSEQLDYATITVVPGRTPGRRFMLLSGRTTFGTQGAAELVTRPEYVSLLQEKLASCARAAGKAEHGPAFQILAAVEIKDGQPVSVAYVTHHDL